MSKAADSELIHTSIGMEVLSQNVFATIVSTPDENLWTYKTADGHRMSLGVALMAPYAANKSLWPNAQDIQYWDDWPVHRPFLILGGIKLQQCDLVQTSSRLPASSDVYEVRRNWPLIRYSGSTRDGIGPAKNSLQLSERNALDLGKAGLDTNLPE